jgi:hypothetical protein
MDSGSAGDLVAGQTSHRSTKAQMDSAGRSILATGAVATAMAVAPRVFAQQIGEGGTTHVHL